MAQRGVYRLIRLWMNIWDLCFLWPPRH